MLVCTLKATSCKLDKINNNNDTHAYLVSCYMLKINAEFDLPGKSLLRA